MYIHYSELITVFLYKNFKYESFDNVIFLCNLTSGLLYLSTSIYCILDNMYLDVLVMIDGHKKEYFT